MPKGEMTLDKLAVMVQQGFASVEERLDRLEGRMDNLEERMGRLEIRMDALEKQVTQLEFEVQAIRRQLSTAVYHPELVVLERRIARLEKKVGIVRK